MTSEDPSPRLPMTRGERRVVGSIALGLCGLFVLELLYNYTPVKASVLWVVVFWVPLLVLHELGHALAARWVGWNVQEITIGFGKDLFRFRYRGTLIRLRAAPLEGYVLPNPRDTKQARLKSAFIYLAGPGVELALALGCWLWFGDALTTRTDDPAMIAIQSLTLAALLGAGFNLLPYSSGSGVSDGLGAILSLFANEELFRQRLSLQYVRAARSALYLEQWERALGVIEDGLARHPADDQLLGLRAVAIAGAGEEQRALDMLEELGHPNDKPPELRHELLLDAAWVVLVSNDQTLLHDAEQACERALGDVPDSVRGNLMLGRVLLERGQASAALQILLRAYRRATEPDEEAQLLAHLTLAARQLDQTDTAERFLSALNPDTIGPRLRARVLSKS